MKKTIPLLSILVPAYNCAGSLERGVLSLVNHKMNHLLEILIVNDGSKDETLQIAVKLAKEWPMVNVVDKKNGGHGSTINVGIEKANGHYFRIMDSDDYFDTEEFVKFLQRLKDETADIVLTDYSEDQIGAKRLKPVLNYTNFKKYQKLQLENLSNGKTGFQTLGPLLSTTTCKTQLLKNANFKLDEHCFYVDMEYNFIVYVSAETIIYYPLNVYRYVKGYAEQSISTENMRKNYHQHEKVCLKLLKEYRKRKDELTVGKYTYLRDKLVAEMCNWHYYILLYYVKDRVTFLKFDQKLRQYPDFYSHSKVASKLVCMIRLCNGYGIKVAVLVNELLNRVRGDD